MADDTGKTTVLIVEDDMLIAQSMAVTLRQEGYRVIVTGTGYEGLEAARSQNPDLVILDLGLPDVSGVEVCRELARNSSALVLFLTAHREEAEKVAALDAGGDDYVTKPIGTLELAARVRALLRRAPRGAYQPAPPAP